MRSKNTEDLDQKIRNDRTFFCSELVATAYKRCGILDKDIAASQYWPGEFSSENSGKRV